MGGGRGLGFMCGGRKRVEGGGGEGAWAQEARGRETQEG